MKKYENKCFVICPIGAEGSKTREKSNMVYSNIVKPALADFEYDPIRADQVNESGIITSQIIQYISNSPLLIADLTDKNPNVFYELAIRHMIKKPCLLIIEKEQSIPFDVASSRVIQYDFTIEGGLAAIDQIKQIVKSIHSDKTGIDNPISIAFDLARLKESGNPLEERIAEIAENINEIKVSSMLANRKLSAINQISANEYLQEKIEEIESQILYDLKRFVSQALLKIKKQGLSEVEIDRLQDSILIIERKIENFKLEQ